MIYTPLFRRAIGFWVLCFLFAAPVSESVKAAEPEDPMRFMAVRPTGLAAAVTSDWYIFASGAIDQGAAARLKALIAADNIPPSSLLLLSSPGGNLLGGIALGRVIRDGGLLTYVNAYNGMTNVGTPASKPALCASACTLAFLGGRFRFIDENSVYAVHRFYFPETGPNTADIAQVLSSTIVQYMRDMGVDPQLFTLSTGAGRDDVIIPTRQQLLLLNVINNGAEKPIWTVESIPQGLYLRGEHNTVWGDNKLAFMCAHNGSLALSVIFPSGGQEALIREQKAAGLLLDGGVLRIPPQRVATPTFKDGTAVVMFLLSPDDVKKLLNSHTVGASLQLSYDAPTFNGVADFDFSDGLKKIVGFMKTCH